MIIHSKISTEEFFLCTLADVPVSFPKMFRAAILQRTCQWNLPLVSNVFEKIIYDHRKCSQPAIVSVKHIQHPLFRILQKCQKEFDSGRFIGTILMDLSKVYDCLRHDFSIAKLEAYGLGNGSLNFLLDYLTFRKQRTKVGSAYSKWSKIRRGINSSRISFTAKFVQYIY